MHRMKEPFIKLWTVVTSNRYQLETTQCRWPSAYHDDAVGFGWSAAWSIQYCSRVQCCAPSATSVVDLLKLGYVDSVLLL
jgi:hypothetical protein